MPVVVREPDQKDYELPEDGSYLGVIADVIDLGEVAGAFGVKPKVQIKWLLNAFNSEGYQFFVSAFYTASLHEKANLRKALKSILGADVTGQFDLEELLGINNQLVIQQNTANDGKVYANVVAILKAPKGERLEIPADFVRKSEKDGEQAKQAKKPAPQMKKPAAPAAPARRAVQPAPLVEEVYEEQAETDVVVAPEVEQEVEQGVAVQAAPSSMKRTAATTPAPANRAGGTIRQARTVSPAPAVAPAVAPRQPARQARTTAPAAPVGQAPIDDEDIPF